MTVCVDSRSRTLTATCCMSIVLATAPAGQATPDTHVAAASQPGRANSCVVGSAAVGNYLAVAEECAMARAPLN